MFDQKNIDFFFTCFQALVIKTLDLDWILIQIRIVIQPKIQKCPAFDNDIWIVFLYFSKLCTYIPVHLNKNNNFPVMPFYA